MVDRTDLKIIEILKKDSRTPLSKISEQIKISKTAIKKRIDKLKKNGIILGFSLKLNDFFNTCVRRAAVGIDIEKDKYFEIIEEIKKIEFVESCYSCTGSHDLYAFVSAPHGLLDQISDSMKKIPGVKEVCFNILQDRKS